MPIDGLQLGLGLTEALAPSVLGLITHLIDMSQQDPAGTEQRVADVYPKIMDLLGPQSASDAAATAARAALAARVQDLWTKMQAPPVAVTLPPSAVTPVISPAPSPQPAAAPTGIPTGTVTPLPAAQPTGTVTTIPVTVTPATDPQPR